MPAKELAREIGLTTPVKLDYRRNVILVCRAGRRGGTTSFCFSDGRCLTYSYDEVLSADSGSNYEAGVRALLSDLKHKNKKI